MPLKRPPYRHVPKKHAEHLLEHLEHYEAEARETPNMAADRGLAAVYVLACLRGTLQHYAEKKR